MGVTKAFFHCVGTTPESMECWKNSVNGLDRGSANSFSTLVEILSGPGAFWGLSSCNIHLTPSTVIFIFGIGGALLGILEGILFVSSSVKTDEYCLFKMFAFPTASAISTPSDLKGGMLIQPHLYPQYELKPWNFPPWQCLLDVTLFLNRPLPVYMEQDPTHL